MSQNTTQTDNIIGNQHLSTTYTKKHITVLLIAAILLLLLLVVEIVGSIMSSSLALLSDAIHVFSDFLGIISSFIAIIITKKVADMVRTYGYSRSEAIVGFANCIILFIMSFYIVYEGIMRFLDPHEINIKTLIYVATFGLIANILIALYVLKFGGNNNIHTHSHNDHDHTNHQHNHKYNILMYNVLLHFAYDISGSIVVIISGIVIYFTNFYIIDPMLSIFIAVILFRSTYKLTKRSINVLLEAVPANIDINKVKKDIEKSSNDIISVHHIHIWMLNEKDIISTFHVTVKKNIDMNDLYIKIKLLLKEKYNINHTTIQMEVETNVCDHPELKHYDII